MIVFILGSATVSVVLSAPTGPGLVTAHGNLAPDSGILLLGLGPVIVVILGWVTVTRVVAVPDTASIVLSALWAGVMFLLSAPTGPGLVTAHSGLAPGSGDILRPNEHKHEVQAA